MSWEKPARSFFRRLQTGATMYGNDYSTKTVVARMWSAASFNKTGLSNRKMSQWVCVLQCLVLRWLDYFICSTKWNPSWIVTHSSVRLFIFYRGQRTRVTFDWTHIRVSQQGWKSYTEHKVRNNICKCKISAPVMIFSPGGKSRTLRQFFSAVRHF